MPYIRKTSDIFISEEFSEILHLMEGQSNIASLLLRRRHSVDSLVENHVNYISVSKSDKTKISYLTADKFNSVDGNFWHSSRRVNIKPGSFLRKIFKDVSNVEVEKFASLYKSIQTSPKFTFKVVEGSDISKYYLYNTYAEDSSSLGASCMKHGYSQIYLRIYVDNPEAVKMLVMLNRNGELMGRALLWTEPKLMDRIYTINDEELQYHFKKWADENGYYHKKEQKWNNTLGFESNGEKHFLETSIKLENHKYTNYPYFDTFKFYVPKEGRFYNHFPENKEFYTLSQPDGSIESPNLLQQDGITKLFYHSGELIWIEYKGVHTHENNVYYSIANSCYILKTDAKFEAKLGDYIFSDDSLNDPSVIRRILGNNSKQEGEVENFVFSVTA